MASIAKHVASVVSTHVARVKVYVWHAAHLIFPNFSRLLFLEVLLAVLTVAHNESATDGCFLHRVVVFCEMAPALAWRVALELFSFN